MGIIKRNIRCDFKYVEKIGKIIREKSYWVITFAQNQLNMQIDILKILNFFLLLILALSGNF
jgi:hypothetical protein